MFFVQIFIFFISIIFISLSIIGFGSVMTRNLKSNFCIDFFFGLIVLSLVVTVFHFFSRVYVLLNILLFVLGLILFLKGASFNYFKDQKKIIFKYLTIILLLTPMYISQKYHEDFGYYHLPYVLAFLEEKIVFGFANVDQTYVYNSIWLNLTSIFFFADKNFDFLTLPSFILFLIFIIFLFKSLFKEKITKVSDYYLLVVLFYFILKFTRISEFGVDIPAIIFSILSIYYFLKYFETDEISEKKMIFFYNLAFSTFSILIKLSAVPILFLTLFLYFKNFRDFKFYIFSYKFLIIYSLLLGFFIQQFIYTGCLFFPTNVSCFNVSWFNENYINLSKKIELINKSYSAVKEIYSPAEYLTNFNWLSHWIERNYIEILEHLTTIILPILIFVSFLKRRESEKPILKEKKIFYFFIFINLIFWLNFSPVYRFGVHIFITLSFIILLNLLISKEFSKKIFISFVSIFLLFSFSKNIFRIINTENILIGIEKIDNLYILRDDLSNENVKIYHPDVENNKRNGWQGRLCWNTPFICSYKELYVDKKNGYLIINKLKN